MYGLSNGMITLSEAEGHFCCFKPTTHIHNTYCTHEI